MESEENLHGPQRKPPSSGNGQHGLHTNTSAGSGSNGTRPKPGKSNRLGPKTAGVKPKCLYLINHEFRALQLDKHIATMSVFDLIDHCASLFEQSAASKDTDAEEAFRLYVRSFLIFNYFVNTFIMLHFNGFARFMESSHQDFIIYLNLYNFYKCDDIVGAGTFSVEPEVVRAWVIEYLSEKHLLTFDVALLYTWLDEYIEYLKNRETSEATENAENGDNRELTESTEYDANSDFPSNLQNVSEEDLFDFNARFPELSLNAKPEKSADFYSNSPNTRHVTSSLDKLPYPVSASKGETLPYPLGSDTQILSDPQVRSESQTPISYVRAPPPPPPEAPAPPVRSYQNTAPIAFPSEMLSSVRGQTRGNNMPNNSSGVVQNTALDNPLHTTHQPPSMGNPSLHNVSTYAPENTLKKYHTDLQLAKASPSLGYASQQTVTSQMPYQARANGDSGNNGDMSSANSRQNQNFNSPMNYGFDRASTTNGLSSSHNLGSQAKGFNQPSQINQHTNQINIPTNQHQSSTTWPRHDKPKNGARKVYAICGLKNLGSSCYINSTVQTLLGLETFEASLLHRKKKSVPQPLTEATAGLLTTFNANGGANIAPTKFLRVLSALKPDFNIPFEQQDAQEFLLFLLDKLHEEMASKPRSDQVDYLKKWNITVNSRDRDEYLKWYKDLLNHEGESPINDTFQGHVQSKLLCNKCGHRSVSYSPFTILSLPIPAGNNQTVDLTDCLRYYTQDEVLTGENAWNCPKCNKTSGENPMDVVFQPKRGLFRLKRSKSPAKKTPGLAPTSISIKQLSFIKLPPVMFIHLSRFSMVNVTDKLNTDITYPLRLKFNHSSHDIYYSLTGLINHYGTLKSGHYTALVNKAQAHGGNTDILQDPIWCYFDDDSVRFNVQHGNVNSSDYNKLHSRDVYVLCYERV